MWAYGCPSCRLRAAMVVAISLLEVVNTDPYLLTLTRYIELNPERGLGGAPRGLPLVELPPQCTRQAEKGQ